MFPTHMIGMLNDRCLSIFLLNNQFLKLTTVPYSHDKGSKDLRISTLGMSIDILFNIQLERDACLEIILFFNLLQKHECIVTITQVLPDGFCNKLFLSRLQKLFKW